MQAWLVTYQANILELLGGLDVVSSPEVCENAIRAILERVPTEELLHGFDLLTDK